MVTNDPTRRDLLTHAAVAAASAASWKQLLAAGTADQDPNALKRNRTGHLFFNLGHEDDHQNATYHVVGGGRRRKLVPLRTNPGVLDTARKENTFLGNVPDASITHFLPPFSLKVDQVALFYVMKADVPTPGVWSMSSMYFYIPLAAIRSAYARAPKLDSGGRVALSAKRFLYGHDAARSEQDYVEEESLKDLTDHATALVGLHPEALSVEPGSAAHIQRNLIQGGPTPSGPIIPLILKLRDLKEAQPQVNAGQPNANGWATLRPLLDPDTGTPLKALFGSNKGLPLYNPEWHPEVKTTAAAVMMPVLRAVKNDVTLGVDVTPNAALAAPDVRGRVWHRRDGITRVEHAPTSQAAATSSLGYTLTQPTPFSGYRCTADVTQSGGALVTLKFENWYVRWLGLWVQFLDAKGKAIPTKNLPPSLQHPGNTDDKVLLGIISPEWTLYGIPLSESTTQEPFTWPDAAGAETAVIEASGLSLRGLPDPEGATNFVGGFLTVMFNMVLPSALLGIGASVDLDIIQKNVVIPTVVLFFRDLALLSIDITSANGLHNLLTAFWKALANQVVKGFLKPVFELLASLFTKMYQYVAQAELEDAIPIAGQIAQAIGILGTLAEIAETTVEVAIAPPAYYSTMKLTHDLNLQIDHDPMDSKTPKSATACFVTALFDGSATPHTMTIPLAVGGLDYLSVVFTDVPRGGTATVSAGFYQIDTNPSAPLHTLVGQASSGALSNTMPAGAPPQHVVTKELEHKIDSKTVYTHIQKTQLAGTRPVWVPTAIPPSESLDPCSRTPHQDLCTPGTLCLLHGITVRQGVENAPGYVGYAWQGDGGSGCSGGVGQLDRISILNTDVPAGGYASYPCGLDAGPQIVYGLLAPETTGPPPTTPRPANNFYLEPGSLLIRRVRLDTDPPSFDTGAASAWGKLNFASDALLLHPTGVLVNVSEQYHHLETLSVPDAPVSDAAAGTSLLAQIHSGFGSRPGLVSSPTAAAVTADGVILVLESGNKRIQAFDVGGNPVPYFKKQAVPYFLNLAADGAPHYLDIAVEHTGYVYVLSYEKSGTSDVCNGGPSPYTYRLDVYGPDQSGTGPVRPISSTTGFHAARLAVDLWRNVYSLNYEALKRPDGVLEPSVSLWIPKG